MGFDDGFLDRMVPGWTGRSTRWRRSRAGAIANPDEKRMVGHYWLRSPGLAPQPAIAAEITGTIGAIKSFAADVHAGATRPPTAPRFTRVCQSASAARHSGRCSWPTRWATLQSNRMAVHFIDNTDPDGVARVLAGAGGPLNETLCIVMSKSGGTPETAQRHAPGGGGLPGRGPDFAQHAVAITMPGSKLDKQAVAEHWLARFPMFDWVGGRTSELSAVGLLPAALQGLDIDDMLAGAAACDEATRGRDPRRNPAALLALMWHHATGGKGLKDMVVLPYKDRLLLFSRYLQQLVMESLGKRLDLDGQRVDQGISCLWQQGIDRPARLRPAAPRRRAQLLRHLYPGPRSRRQPHRDGARRHGRRLLPRVLLGTREALFGNDRESMTITSAVWTPGPSAR